MHTCSQCGKAMATLGGLEIHVELSHAAPTPEPEPEAAPTPAAPVQTATPVTSPAPAASPILRGYDPTIPLTALLVVVMLFAGIGVAVHRSGSPSHHLVAAVTSDAETSSGDLSTPTSIVPVPRQTPATPAPSPGGSPAAIPPAGSQPPVAAQTSAPCQQAIATLSTRPSKRSVDIANLMRANGLPALPLPGFEHPNVDALTRYDTVQEYIDDAFDPSDPDAAVWQQSLEQAGFVGAEQIDFTNAGTRYGAIVFRFANSAGAHTYNRATLGRFCSEGVLQNAQPLTGLSGGMSYVILQEGAPPFRASFVAGDSVVRVNLCHCVQAPDDQALAGQWAQNIAAQVGAA
jgi:hypothetical protein